MKLSQFNVVHEHNGSLLIMNARTGGILVARADVV